jgi:hypothetical protein
VRGLCVGATGLQQRRWCASAVSGGGHIEAAHSKESASVVVTREHGKNGKLIKALVRSLPFCHAITEIRSAILYVEWLCLVLA